MTLSNTFIEKVLRLSFVLVIIFSYGLVIYTKENYFGTHICIKHDISLALCIVLLLWGRFVPITFLFLNFILVEYRAAHGISTLATTVACMTSFSLIANNLLVSKNNRNKSFLSRLDFSVNRYICRIIKPRLLHIYAFTAYAVCSLLAMSLHYQDQTWIRGSTVGELLSSSYICRFHSVFVWLETKYPFYYYIFSAIIGLLQTLFQTLMLFSLFSKKIFVFTKYWGWIFIINSLVFLQLSYLPFVELILWLSLFNGFSGCGKKFNFSLQFIKSHKTVLSLFMFTVLSYIFYHFNFLSKGSISDSLNFKKLPNSYNFFKSIGLEYPNVFNTTDLKMSEHWLVLYRTKLNSKIENPNLQSTISNTYSNLSQTDLELVPFTKESGEKGYYQLSDLMYYGNSLPYRRTLNFLNPHNLHDNNDKLSSLIESRILFDYRHQKLNGSYLYVGSFRTRLPNDKHSSKNIFNIVYYIDSTIKVYKLPNDFEPIKL